MSLISYRPAGSSVSRLPGYPKTIRFHQMANNRGSPLLQCVCGRCPFLSNDRDQLRHVPAQPHRFCLLIARLSLLADDRLRAWPPREVRSFIQLCYALPNGGSATSEVQWDLNCVAVMNAIRNEQQLGRGDGPFLGPDLFQQPIMDTTPIALSSNGVFQGCAITDLYRLPRERTINVVIRLGISGEPDTVTNIRTQTRNFSYTFAEWFLGRRYAFAPKFNLHNGVWKTAKCIYTVGNEQHAVTTGSRMHLPSLLIDIFTHALLAPKEADDGHWTSDVHVLWQATAVCEVCGATHEQMDEFIPFVNCRFCSARPCFHHGRCCPVRIGRQHMAASRTRKLRYVDIRDEDNVRRLLRATMTSAQYNAFVNRHMQVCADGVCEPA